MFRSHLLKYNFKGKIISSERSYVRSVVTLDRVDELLPFFEANSTCVLGLTMGEIIRKLHADVRCCKAVKMIAQKQINHTRYDDDILAFQIINIMNR